MRRREWLAALLAGAAWPLGLCAEESLETLIGAAGPVARRVLGNPAAWQPQVLLTRCRREGGQWRALPTQSFGLRPRQWFAAASWVKLPLAGLLLEELDRRGLDLAAGALRLEVDGTAACAPLPATQPGGWPLAGLLQAMLVVSDNLAYNALFELLGSDAIHARLRELGFPNIRMATRLGCPQPRSPGKLAARLRDARGAVVWESPAQPRETFQRFPHGNAGAGRAWAEAGRVIPGAHDFSDSNFIPLADVHHMTLEFGGGVGLLFELSAPPRRWLADTLSLVPRQAAGLSAEQRALPDEHSKWLLPLEAGGHFPPQLRIHSKNAQSYGWIGDSAFIADERAGRACALTIVLFVDRDGVLNDGVYDYAGTGRPFLREVGGALWNEVQAAPQRSG
jgi:hypothetical protein